MSSLIQYKPSESEVNEIKQILQMNENDYSRDSYIATMLPLLVEAVMAHTNNTFGIRRDGSADLPGGVKIYLAKALERNGMKTGLKSRSMGSVSYSYDTSVPVELMDFLKPYRKVRFHAKR